MTISNHEFNNYERINRIKVEMALADHSKTKLAELLGISRYAISLKLKGGSPWTIIELKI